MNVFKRFIVYYKPYLKEFTMDMFCALVLSLVDLSVPMITSFLVKDIFLMTDKTQMFDIVTKYSLILLVIYIIRALSQFYVNSQGHIMGSKMEADMRSDLFEHLEKLSFYYYDNNNTGVMMSRMISDLFDVTELAHHGPEDVFISIIKLTGSFIILSSINIKLTFVLVVIVFMMAYFSYKNNRKVKKAFRDNRKKIGNVNSILQDSLSGIRVVKSFSNEDIELQKFAEGNQLFLESKSNSYKNMGVYFSINSLFHGLLYISVFFFGGYLIKTGEMDNNQIITYILYINMFLEPINKLINFTELFQKGYTGFERMLEVMDTEPDIIDAPNAIEITNVKGNIKFQDVSFQYDKKNGTILDNINLDIPKGKTIALVGPSGAGKTTLCSLIPRFYEVTDGQITIDGINVKHITMKSLRQNIGIVQQDVYIFNSTLRENISYGKPEATFDEIVDASKRANLHDFIMSLDKGYDTQVGERGVRFSGGQKQRISIARVFLKNPPILILDEATSSLDNESEKYIQNSLEELSKNRTTLIIAHRLSTIRNADEIIVLNEDGIQERGNHSDLLDMEGLYADLYNMQFDILT